MAAKNDWVDGQQVTAATMNALGDEVNTKAAASDVADALAAKAPLASPAFTGTPTGITKTHVGLGNVDNVSQATILTAAASASKSADTITDGITNKAYTAAEKTRLANTSGTNTGDQTSVTGNAGTATKLATARTINGVSFDGTANITVTDATKEATANKGAANGYAPLDASQLVPAVNLPSYVDDVLEFANLAALPVTGTTGKIFVALDTGKIYRWSGSAYVEISPSPGSTDSVTEGSSNLYYTNTRADARVAAAAASGTGSIVRNTSPTITTPTITGYTETTVASGTVTTAATLTITAGTVLTATLTASTACTFTMPTATTGKSFVLLLKQAQTTGLGTATFTGVKWPTAGAPTITATAGKMDILTFVADGTNWYGTYVQGFTY